VGYTSNGTGVNCLSCDIGYINDGTGKCVLAAVGCGSGYKDDGTGKKCIKLE
jgi:hypothetical protein